MRLAEFGFGTLITIIIVFIIAVLIFQLIWNAVMPGVFGCKEISFWQVIGLLILSNILFGGHCNSSAWANY